MSKNRSSSQKVKIIHQCEKFLMQNADQSSPVQDKEYIGNFVSEVDCTTLNSLMTGTKPPISAATTETMTAIVFAAEQLAKAACTHVETAAQNLVDDTLENLRDLTEKSSSTMEKSFDTMKELILTNADEMKRKDELAIGLIESSLTTNRDSIKQVDTSIKKMDAKLDTLNDNLTSLKDELAHLNKTLQKQAITHKLEWAVSNFDKISEPFTYFSYQQSGKTVDFTKCSSSTLIKQILLAFLRGEGYDINLKTLSRQNKDDGEKQFREMISKEIQAIMGQKPRIEAGAGRCMMYST